MIDDYTDDDCRVVLQEFGESLADCYKELPYEIQKLVEEHFYELL